MGAGCGGQDGINPGVQEVGPSMDVNSEGIPWRAGCGEPDGVSLACNRVVGSGGRKACECMCADNTGLPRISCCVFCST